jgi:hypothetical protein
MAFAENTKVPVEQSRAEIERLLLRYGADGFAYGRDGLRSMVGFRASGRSVRFEIAMPGPADPEMRRTATGRTRTDKQAELECAQESRRRWRALTLVVKAKLESVVSGVETFEEAFAGQLVLPGGQTVGQWLPGQLAEADRTGQLPRGIAGLLGPGGD